MPIRFRCPHCQQLLGIARRKAGTEVRCPTCQNEVLVPLADEPAPSDPVLVAPLPAIPMPATAAPLPAIPMPETAAPSQPALFEREDFDALLRGAMTSEPGQASVARVPPPPRVQGGPAPLELNWQAPTTVPGTGTSLPPGLVLSPRMATVLAAVVVFLLGMAFGLGLLVGRIWR